jgi:hypothetical protein
MAKKKFFQKFILNSQISSSPNLFNFGFIKFNLT